MQGLVGQGLDKFTSNPCVYPISPILEFIKLDIKEVK